METTALDIQAKRAAERITIALEAAPIVQKQITTLRKKAEALAAEAEVAERAQVQAFANLEGLKQARAAASADLAELLQLQQAADNTDVEAKIQIVRLLASNRANDVFGKSNFLLSLDSLARLKVIAPAMPELLAEKQATAAALDRQIRDLSPAE
jgi:uncharacterized coiled-coil DUF342 family protein